MRRLALVVLLGLNGIMQLGGGTMMTLRPAKMAREVFHTAPTPEAQKLLGVIGGATLSFALLSVVTFWTVLRDQRRGFALARVQGVMLGLVGGVMVATGTSAGAIDIAKGVVIALVAWSTSATELEGAPAG